MSNHAGTMFETAMERLIETRPLLPMYTHLIISALFPIYTGAHASLSRPSTAAPPEKKEKHQDSEDEEEEAEVVQKMEGLTASDAIVFPITAGLTLAGLYYVITKYGAEMINLILGWYFGAVGLYSVGKIVNDTAHVVFSFVFPTYFVSSGKLFVIKANERRAVAADSNNNASRALPSPLFFSKPLASTGWAIRSVLTQKYSVKIYLHGLVDVDLKLDLINVSSMAASVVSILYANLGGKPWWLTNLQGFGVCYSAMQFMSPTTFATGSLILIALFFYDIWAVFFTPLMVTVATNLDQPIKLVFPKPDEPGATPDEPPLKTYSMLGLGDIVLPGLMIGLALRFDLYMFYLKQQKKLPGKDEQVTKAAYVPVTGHWGDRIWCMTITAGVQLPARLQSSFPKPYFTACMVGYVIGMLVTLGVMSIFQHAQPALLYLVPGVLISAWTTGLVRGEIKPMWEFTEAITGEQIEAEQQPNSKLTAGEKDKDKALQEKDGRSWWLAIWHELFGSNGEDGKHVATETTSPAGTEAGKGAIDDDCLVSVRIARHHPRRKSNKSLDRDGVSAEDGSADVSAVDGEASTHNSQLRSRKPREKGNT